MIDAGPSLHAAERLSAAALAIYLRLTGWTSQPSAVSGVTILSRTLPEADEPVLIILPKAPGSSDERRRVADALRTIEAVEERPIPAIVDDVCRSAAKSKKTIAKRESLDREKRPDSISELYGIEPSGIEALKSLGIKTTSDLLEAAATSKDRKVLAARTGFHEPEILRWAALADRMRIRGVREPYAELLREAGVDTVRELKYRNPVKLALAMEAANRKRKLVRLLPKEKKVASWIAQAKMLAPKIKY